jgi:ribosomal protein L34
MRDHSGYYFEDWRRRMAASVGAVILDDRREQG